jgi:hypothetical protein
MQSALPSITKAAIVLLALLSVGPLVSALDLVFNFLPNKYPALQHWHTASPLGKSLWVGAGFLGVLSIYGLMRLPKVAMAASIAFAAVYVLGANFVWQYFTMGCWLAIAAAILTLFGARATLRANYSLKRTVADGLR